MDQATILEAVRALKAKGLPKPKDVSNEMWEAAGPYAPNQVSHQVALRLQEQVLRTLPEEMPGDPVGILQSLFGPAVATAIDVMFNADRDSDRLAAAKMLTEYAIGKPEQKVTHTGSIAVAVHDKLSSMARDIQEGRLLDVQNLLAKPDDDVHDFIKQHAPDKFVVGQKGQPNAITEDTEG